MEISAVALPFLILAAALGLPAQASLRVRSSAPGVHRPRDCCLSYTTENIKCELMMDYVRKIITCPLPAVVFTTKDGLQVCADTRIKTVKDCIEDLDSAKKWGKVSVDVNLQ